MINLIKRLVKHQGFIKYFKNTSWLLFEKVLKIFAGLLVGAWVARYLGPDKFGLINYAQSIVGLFIVLSTLGLDSIVIRELVNDESKSDVLLGTSFTLKLIGALFTFVILATVLFIRKNDAYTNTIVFIIASGLIFQSFNVIDFYFQSKVLSKYVVFSNIISLFLSSIVKIMLILCEAPLIYFAIVISFDYFTLALGYIYFYKRKQLLFSKWKFDSGVAKDLIVDSWPLVLSGIVVSIYMKIDQVMIKEMMSNTAVGEYAAAVRLSETSYILPGVITASLFPAIINSKKKDSLLYINRMQKLYSFIIWSGIFISILTTIFSVWVIGLLYGEEYINSAEVLIIHIWALVFVGLGVASSSWLVTENLQKHSFYRTLSGGIINIILNIIFIPRYQIKGAAFATLLSQSFAALFYDVFFRSTRKAFFMKIKSVIFLWK